MYKKTFLDNKIPLIMDTVQDVRSLCIGIWVKVGSRNEQPEKNGISHFLEHMLFKGTMRRSSEGIAMEIDSLGGELNAYTSSEYTLFYIKVLDQYMEQAIDLLSDIFINSTLPDQDIEKEKQIIGEEIKMVEDTPSDYVYEIFNKNIWGEEGLGQTVLGKVETIRSFRRSDLAEHIRKFYGTNNIVIACSGRFDEAVLFRLLNSTVGSLSGKGSGDFKPAQGFAGRVDIVEKDLSEAHICLGLEGLPYRSEERYIMHLLNTILGAGFSSRLFQNVREKKGLAYSIYSYHASYYDTGLWVVYAGTDRKHAGEVINITVDEIRNLRKSVTAEELQRAKSQLKGNLILALESTSSKMTNIGKQEIYYGQYFSPEEIIRMVDEISLERLKELAGRLADTKPFALTVYGPLKEKELKDSCILLK